MTDIPSRPVSEPHEESTGRGLMIGGLVLGITSVVFGWLVPLLGVIAGVIGIIISPMGIKRARKWTRPTSVGTAGLILSIIGVVWSVIWWIVYAARMSQDTIAY
ncbi:MAG: hypothetical protein GXY38_01280 [Planctomycetes bacterium]|jgi:uncharacterized membrane protein|nr:hypothetical protein [Planctomycetota bacterium]